MKLMKFIKVDFRKYVFGYRLKESNIFMKRYLILFEDMENRA